MIYIHMSKGLKLRRALREAPQMEKVASPFSSYISIRSIYLYLYLYIYIYLYISR